MRRRACGSTSRTLYSAQSATMKDLFRCLDEYPVELHRAIADAWDIDLPRDEPLRTVLRLGEGMLAVGALQRMIATLSPAAQEALGDVVSEGGALPLAF